MTIQPQSFVSGRDQRLHARALRDKFFPQAKTLQDSEIVMRGGHPVHGGLRDYSPSPPAIEEVTSPPVVIRSSPIEDEPIRTPKISEIQMAVCDVFAVRLIDLISARRTADIVKPRQIAMGLCKRLTLRSLPDIGRRFGGRDHTTALHGVRKYQWAFDLVAPQMLEASTPRDWASAIKAYLSSSEILDAAETQRATRAAKRRQTTLNRKSEYLARRLSISFDEARSQILDGVSA